MSKNWRKLEDELGYPFYMNEATDVKQWDHPKFSDLKQRIDDCNYVKFSMYRVALKFRVLQSALHMEEIPLDIVTGVFERHKLCTNEASLCLECCDLEAVLADIYFAANKKNHTNIDIDYATELMVNFLYNVFDRERRGNIQVSSTKLVLAILSNCTLIGLYKFLFVLFADHNKCVTRLRLQSLLTKVSEITTFLNEDGSYGPHLANAAIENCFFHSPGLVGISESSFIAWLEETPKILVWIPLLHRIKVAEPVIHLEKCKTCKTNSFMGLRYKCNKCSRYTQCQRCFFGGRTSHSHKLSHAMREYCTRSNDYKPNLVKKLCGLLHCSQLDSTVIETKRLREGTCNRTAGSRDVLSNIEPLSSPQTQLQVIIRQLELQNKELQQILHLGSRNEKELKRFLDEHRVHIATQVQKLKILMECLTLPTGLPQSIPQVEQGRNKLMESTPMVQNTCRTDLNPGLELLSPIASLPVPPPDSNYEGCSQDFNSRSYCIDDLSTWIGGHPTTSKPNLQIQPSRGKTPVREFQNDLDDALAKLQQILASNFSLDQSLGHLDNNNLKFAVSEVEGMLTSFIDSVASSRRSSVRSRMVDLEKI